MLQVLSSSPTEMQRKALTVRRHIITMISNVSVGHVGPALSIVEILTALYFGVLRCNPERPDDPDRDRFILSKGHACCALYAVLAERGYFPVERLREYRQYDSLLAGHPHKGLPGIELATGSLGHGLSIALGVALTAKMNKKAHRVFALLGDGECQEGSVWEAAMAAAHLAADNLTAIVDRNMLSLDGFTEQVMALEPFADKWRAFGWEVRSVDGHNLQELVDALHTTPFIPGKPSVVVARTTKGKGIDFAENRREWHHKGFSASERDNAFQQLDTQLRELQKTER